MKKSLFYIATAALVLVSCNEEELVQVPTNQVNSVLTATFEQNGATRMHIGEGNALTWTSDDAIAVYYEGDDGYGQVCYALSSGENTANGTFQFREEEGETAPEEIYGAAFPYHSTGNITDNKLSISLLSSLSGTESGMLKLPMWGKVTDGSIAFKHLAGVLKVNLADVPEGYNTLTVTADKPIAGEFSVDLNVEDGRYPVLASTSTDDANKTVTVEFTAATDNANDYILYLPLPVNTYASIVVSASKVVTDGENKTTEESKVLKQWTNKTVERAKVYSTSVTDYESVMTEAELRAAAEKGGTVTLGADIELTQPLTINNAELEVSIDLGTYSLTNNTAYDYDNCGETECYVFEVKNGTLNITGTTGSVNAIAGSDYDMAVFANTNGKVNISGGKFINLGKENDGCDLIYARDNAVITISGGEFEAGHKSSDVGNQYVALNLRDKSEASIIVTGGKFHKFNPAYNVSENPKKNFAANNTMVAVSGDENAKVYEVIDLTNGYTMANNIEIETPITINTTSEIAFELGSYSLINKTAYDYDNCGETECYVFEVQAGTLNINGNGSVNAIAGSDYDMAVFANTNGKVNISGGKFTNLGKENDGCDLIYARDNAVITISGGEFEAGHKSSDVGNQYVALNLRDKSEASIIVTGGKFYKFNPAYNVSENPKKNFAANNTMVAVSGDENAKVYEVIDLTNGYTMANNIEIETPITINTTSEIAFELGSHSLINKTAYDYDNCGETECYVFEVQAGTLNINGNGSVNAIAGSDYDMAVFANTNGKVNISGGKFTNLGKENDGCDLIYVRDNASVVISGGEFTAGNNSPDVGNQYVALNLRDADRKAGTCSIAVSGGRFFKFDPANNVSEGANTNFVSEGYVSQQSEDYYVVSQESGE